MRESMKKILMTISFCFTFFVLFGFNAFAETIDNDVETHKSVEVTTNRVTDYFDWNKDQVSEMVITNDFGPLTGPSYSIYEIEQYQREVLKDLGALQLSSGFARNRVTTFLKTKAIAGVGRENTVVGLFVFHYEIIANERVLVVTQDHLSTLGRSGLYNERISIDYVGCNYVLIAVEDPETYEVRYRMFKVVRKEVETRDLLENMTIDFFDEQVSKPNFNKFVPGIDSFGF